MIETPDLRRRRKDSGEEKKICMVKTPNIWYNKKQKDIVGY